MVSPFLRNGLLAVGSLLLAGVLVGCGSGDDLNANGEKQTTVTIYTSRSEHLVKPLFDRYTQETGTRIRYITDSAGPLIQRLKAEGATTPADMLITVDVGNLWLAAKMDLFRTIESPVLESNIPEKLRDSQNRWVGLSVRARTIVYASDRVKPEELSTYEALAEPQWEGRLCLRTSKKVYNQSLVASLIKSLGTEKAEQVVRGWVDNLATPPFSNDVAAMEAVLAGQCDVTIVNTYYFGRLKKEKPDAELALFWPNQDDRGVHVNVSGAGITRYAKQPEAAQKLLEWFSTPEIQKQFAEVNQEYPANPNVEPSDVVRSWGEFKADAMNVETAGSLQGDAVRLMDRAGYL